MENNKQTAVEWLVSELRKPYGDEFFNKIIDQAKEMEKQQRQIELPSDEEIGQEFKYSSENGEVRQAIEHGAKWMRDKIQGGNK